MIKKDGITDNFFLNPITGQLTLAKVMRRDRETRETYDVINAYIMKNHICFWILSLLDQPKSALLLWWYHYHKSIVWEIHTSRIINVLQNSTDNLSINILQNCAFFQAIFFYLRRTSIWSENLDNALSFNKSHVPCKYCHNWPSSLICNITPVYYLYCYSRFVLLLQLAKSPVSSCLPL